MQQSTTILKCWRPGDGRLIGRPRPEQTYAESWNPWNGSRAREGGAAAPNAEKVATKGRHAKGWCKGEGREASRRLHAATKRVLALADSTAYLSFFVVFIRKSSYFEALNALHGRSTWWNMHEINIIIRSRELKDKRFRKSNISLSKLGKTRNIRSKEGSVPNWVPQEALGWVSHYSTIIHIIANFLLHCRKNNVIMWSVRPWTQGKCSITKRTSIIALAPPVITVRPSVRKVHRKEHQNENLPICVCGSDVLMPYSTITFKFDRNVTFHFWCPFLYTLQTPRHAPPPPPQ